MKLDADKVRWYRDRFGWTLDITAEKAEVAPGTILRAEHGEDIRPSSGRRIARAFGVDISELVPDKPGAPAQREPVLSGKAEAPPPGPNEYPPVLDISNEDFKELVEGLDYDQAGDLMRELMDWLDEYKQGLPDLQSFEEISEYGRTHRREDLRAMRAGGRAVTLFKWRRGIAEEEKTRLEGLLVSKEQAAELATL